MAQYGKLPQSVKYNLKWPTVADPLMVEMEMVRHGGRWKKKDNEFAGEGMEFHFKELMKLLWPWIVWHPWAELQVKCYLEYRIIGQIGAASTGKSFIPAACVLADYYCYPSSTTVMVTSTTRESLEMRVWGEIKKLHKSAKTIHDWLMGYLIEGRQRIVSDPKDEAAEGRDFRNGLVGVACKRGQSFQGIEEFCFPAGTMVDTPTGQRAIEDIRPGDDVISATGPDKVIANMIRTASDLLRITLSDGRVIDCTPNHQFLTIMGWKNAVDISYGDMLLSTHETMQILREEVHAEGSTGYFLRQVLLSEMDCGTTRYDCQAKSQHGLQGYGQEDKPVSDGQREGKDPTTRTNEEVASVHNGQTQEGWDFTIRRQRGGSQEGTRGETSSHVFSGGAIQLLCPYGSKFKVGEDGSTVLSGPCVAGHKAGRRGGRTIPQDGETTGEGFEERRMAYGTWVDSVEVLHGSGPMPVDEANNRGYPVYNLSVEGHPSYSVQGCVVHNCGIKNKHLRLLADEGQFMPRSFVDSISNLNKNKDFKCVMSGNPKDTTDGLGVLCEPAAHIGGWDGGVDQSPKTKTWGIRFPKGICIQLPGSDSPNLDGHMGIPIITQEQIDADIKFYGKDSLQCSMMDEGRMPRGQGSRRVITRQLCLKHGAMEDPIWLNSLRTRIGALDAAYRGVGGDRCVFMELAFGLNSDNKMILALVDSMIVPIKDHISEPAEDQIAVQVKEQCERRGIKPEFFGFDSTGRGSLMAAFGRIWSPNVTPVEFGGRASERPVSTGIDVLCKDYYSKFVTELWYSIRLVIEGDQFRGMTEDVMAEGCMREWTIVGGNKIEVEPKDKTKLKTGRSPDLFDTLATGVELARRHGFKIDRIINPEHRSTDQQWKRELRDRARALWSNHSLSYK